MTAPGPAQRRLRAHVHGAVQGVGFRPFVYRLATRLGLRGWVVNSSSGVVVEVDGPDDVLDEFLVALRRDKPPRAIVQGLEAVRLEAAGFDAFQIRESVGGDKRTLVLPDIATCPDCLREVFDPGNRRYRYPFTNCTNCGPRFSIVEALPYDRPKTTMARFAMCDACRREYDDPLDRRFHAQPNACPACGPSLALWTGDGRAMAAGEEALSIAEDRIRRGEIVALKGLGGFHLLVDARNDAAVERLRRVKAREEKPFALMFPTLESVRLACEVSAKEASLLSSPESPIVLLRRRSVGGRESASGGDAIARGVAPGNPSLGAMLPYTPLHHLLMADLGFAIVATSGNRSDEPICTDEREAIERLAGMADVFLVHDRPIARHVDDSIVRVAAGRELVLRRARGLAPLPVPLDVPAGTILGVGAHLKNSVALAVDRNVFVSQHVGDLDTPEALRAFERVIGALEGMYDARPTMVACDAHVDYRSTRYATARGVGVRRVQHHLAHITGGMAENQVSPPALGVAWDGTGYGLDGTIWGGEWLLVEQRRWRRVASFVPFALPGGDAAVREPRRTAAAVLAAAFGDEAWGMVDLPPIADFGDADRRTIRAMIDRRLNSPLTSSAGRLFDAVAALVGLRQRTRYEGQAAMELEFAIAGTTGDDRYHLAIENAARAAADGEHSAPILVDWRPMIREIVSDIRHGCPAGTIARRFHDAMAQAILDVALDVGCRDVVLSGGCFQNRFLLERAVDLLGAGGFRAAWPQRLPPNDGGIAFGQVAAVAWGLAEE